MRAQHKYFDSHETVQHTSKEYVRGDITTNTVESYFSVFKRGMRGVYQHCGEKHLHRYLAEFDFRYNNRASSWRQRWQPRRTTREGHRWQAPHLSTASSRQPSNKKRNVSPAIVVSTRKNVRSNAFGYVRGTIMVGEAIAGLSAVKTAFDMAKALQNIHDTVARPGGYRTSKRNPLRTSCASGAAFQRVSDLEKEVARFEEWAAEKKRYQLTDYGGATFAYALKPDAANGEPPHRLCAPCYQKGHKSILQFSNRGAGQDYYECPSSRIGAAMVFITAALIAISAMTITSFASSSFFSRAA